MLGEKYYAVAAEYDSIPEGSEWEADVDYAKENAIELGTDATEDYIVYEITVKPLYRTERTVTVTPF
jgi:hypothetical protein